MGINQGTMPRTGIVLALRFSFESLKRLLCCSGPTRPTYLSRWVDEESAPESRADEGIYDGCSSRSGGQMAASIFVDPCIKLNHRKVSLLRGKPKPRTPLMVAGRVP